MSKKIAVLVIVVFSLSVASSAVKAALLDVRADFNDRDWDDGSGFVEPVGWNVIAQADLNNITKVHADLTDFNTGLVAPVTLQITKGFFLSGINSTNVLGWSSPDAPWVVDTVLRDYAMVYSSGNPCQITVGGLDTDSDYQIDLLSVRSASGVGVFTITDESGTNYDDTGDSSVWNASTHGMQDKRIMTWSDLAPDVDGKIIIDVNYTTNYAFLNGMRITEVPEPSTFLIAMGLLVVGLGMSRPGRGWSRNGGNRG